MALAGDSILVTPGTGATVATHTVNAKEHQVVMVADDDGHVVGSKLAYVINIPSQVHVAVASTVHWDLFNADATLLVRVLSIRHVPDQVTAVATGVPFNWLLERTTSVGTGGAVITPWLPDTSQTVLDTDITCRSKPTGGATAGIDLRNHQSHGEETNVGNNIASSLGGTELIPEPLQDNRKGITLRQNQGIREVQVTNSALGNSAWVIVFTVE